MFDFQRKKKLRTIFYSPVMVGLVILIALYAIYSTAVVYHKMVVSKESVDQSQKKLLALDTQNTTLDQDTSALATEQGKEDEIRNKFGMAKAGESMAVIVEADSAHATDTTSQSWWSKLLNFFGI